MSIASAIQTKQQQVANAYTACNGKGATMPVTQDLTNLATCIGSIQTGGSPTLQTKSVSLTNKNGQTFSADNGYDGLSQITVTPNNQARTVTPTKQQQSLTVNSGYSGNGTITVNAVNSSIDSNITVGNIKNGVSILGVTGNYTGTTPTGTLNITANGTYDVTNYASANVSVSGSVSFYTNLIDDNDNQYTVNYANGTITDTNGTYFMMLVDFKYEWLQRQEWADLTINGVFCDFLYNFTSNYSYALLYDITNNIPIGLVPSEPGADTIGIASYS